MTDNSKTVDQDAGKGAVEGDRPEQQQHGNRNAPAIDENGMPSDPVKIAEDAIGANEDETEGG